MTLVPLCELDENRFGSLKIISNNVLAEQDFIHRVVKDRLGEKVSIINLDSTCINQQLTLDSISIFDDKKVLKMFKNCGIDTVMIFSIVWRFKSQKFPIRCWCSRLGVTNNMGVCLGFEKRLWIMGFERDWRARGKANSQMLHSDNKSSRSGQIQRPIQYI